MAPRRVILGAVGQLSLPFLFDPAPRPSGAHSDALVAQLPAPRVERPRAPETPREAQAKDQQLQAAALLAERLTHLLREPVEVELTDNAWTMVSYRRVAGRLRYRLHHMFGGAGPEVVRALAGFTGHRRRAHGR